MTINEVLSVDCQRIQHQFAGACHSYDNAARLQRLTGKGLMAIDHFAAIDAADLVLDLGCGTGINTDILAGISDRVIGCDLAFDMLKKTRSVTADNNVACIQGDAANLPFADQCFSVVYSNLMLQWFDDLQIPLVEIRRVLKPQGQLLFTTLLDGTLSELKSAWALIDDDNHVNRFGELKSVKQALEACGFAYQIALETVVLDYDHVLHLARELKYLGANYVKGRSNKGLTGKQKWLTLAQHYQQFRKSDGTYPATYQVAYIRAFCNK